MTLTIDLTSAEEARLLASAQQSGLEPVALAKKLVTDHLPPPRNQDGSSEAYEQARIARIRAAQGSLAHIAVTVDDLHQDRQADKQTESANLDRRL